jgi:hypothetical protein
VFRKSFVLKKFEVEELRRSVHIIPFGPSFPQSKFLPVALYFADIFSVRRDEFRHQLTRRMLSTVHLEDGSTQLLVERTHREHRALNVVKFIPCCTGLPGLEDTLLF